MTMHRRDLLKAGLAGLPLVGLPRSLQAMTKIVNHNRPAIGSRRLLTIYLRGGSDPLNMLIPKEDPFYDPAGPNSLRKAVGVPLNKLLSVSGYPALGLHPALAQLRAIDPSKVAYLYRTGNQAGERSHFTEQHLTETGRSVYDPTDSGWLSQALKQASSGAVLPSVSLGKRLMRTYLTTNPNTGVTPTHLQTPYSLEVGANTMRQLTVGYGNPGTPTESISNRVADSIANGNPAYVTSDDGQYLRDTISGATTSLASLRTNLPQFEHKPEFPVDNGTIADIPPAGMTAGDVTRGTGFFARLEEAVNLLASHNGNAPLASVAGVELGGWDTHSNQQKYVNGNLVSGDHPPLMRILAQGLKAAFDRLSQDAQPFLIYVVTEFGRTVKDNGSGTDHGNGSLTIVLGSNVDGGVWNLHHPSWTPPALPSLVRGAQWLGLDREYIGLGATPGGGLLDALDPVTDFRLPLIEIVRDYFGVDVPATGSNSPLPPDLLAEWQDALASGSTLGFLQ